MKLRRLRQRHQQHSLQKYYDVWFVRTLQRLHAERVQQAVESLEKVFGKLDRK